MFNSELKEAFPYLLSEAHQLHVNDPYRRLLILIARDLMLLDKQRTLDYLKTIQEGTHMFYAISSGCLQRFPSQGFLDQCKKEIERFKQDKEYESLCLHYQEGVDYLAAHRKNQIQTREWREKQKVAK